MIIARAAVSASPVAMAGIGPRAPPGPQRGSTRRLPRRRRRPRPSRPCAGARRSNARAISKPAARAIRRRRRIGIVGRRRVAAAARGFSRPQIGETSAMNVLRSVSRTTRPRSTSAHAARSRAVRAARAKLVRCSTAPRGSEAEHLGRRFADRSPILVFGLDDARRLPRCSPRDDRARLPAGRRRCCRSTRSVTTTRRSTSGSRRIAAPSLSDASYVGSMIGDIPFIPALVILTALGAAILRRWRVVRVHRRRDPRRGRDLPRDESDRAPRAADGAASRSRASARQPELPVGPRRGLGRRLRRARVAHLVARAQIAGSMIPVWTLAIALPLDRRRVAHVPRHAPPDRRRRRRPDGPRRAGHRAVRRRVRPVRPRASARTLPTQRHGHDRASQ